MATFQQQSLGTRLRKVVRNVKRLQYPLSEPSEPIFDLERYGPSSNGSGSTRHSCSTFRRTMTGGPNATGRRDSRLEEQDEVDIVVVETKAEESQDGNETEGNAGDRYTAASGSDHESTRYGDTHGSPSAIASYCRTISFLVQQFFFTKFQDPVKERHYQKESWFLAKRIAIWTSVYFYIAWILILAFGPRPFKTFDFIGYVGILAACVLPLLPAVLLDAPSRYPWAFRCFLFLTTWSWSTLIAAQLINCHYYGTHPMCAGRDFVGWFYYLIAMPTMSLFALRQSRIVHLAGTVGTLAYIGAILIPLRSSYIRHFLNLLLFHVFILYISYAREKSDRKIFNLRDQLKVQYKATQKAQVNESRASDMKKRFVNYIFHEVRVPLNTSLLAIQNLIGEDVFKDAAEDQVELVDVLQSSLGMMEKVLNDVLDFNRMEAGKLLYATNPFDFSKVIRSVFLGLNVAANAKSVKLENHLDPRIEQLGDLMGDEMRLRQILSNLTSNACKFTSQGGSVVLTTRLLLGTEDDSSDATTCRDEKSFEQDLSTGKSRSPSTEDQSYISPAQATIGSHRPSSTDKVTIRMEVQDTGIGIRQHDIRNDRLFSPYVQTEIGKRQGGKGTGLGLALVRNIVQLSGGRLGLRSKPGVGSIFWVELQYPLADPSKLRPFIKQDILRKTKSHASETSVPKTSQSQITVHEHPSEVILEEEALEVADSRPRVVRIASSVESLRHSPQSTTTTTTTTVIVPAPSGAEVAGEHRPILHHLHSSEIEVVDHPPSLLTNVLQPRPFSPADATIMVPPEILESDLDDQPLSILVVDDDPLTRRLMSRMITRLGHTVQVAENGQVALDAIRLHMRPPTGSEPSLKPFDLVFLDNQMPVLSGVEMVTRARMEGIETMIVGVTGNAMKEDQDEYLECGADHVLIKPVMEPSIKKMMQIAKDHRRTTKGNPNPSPTLRKVTTFA